MGRHLGANAKTYPTVTNLAEQIGQKDSRLVNVGAMEPLGTQRAHTDLLANPFPAHTDPFEFMSEPIAKGRRDLCGKRQSRGSAQKSRDKVQDHWGLGGAGRLASLLGSGRLLQAARANPIGAIPRRANTI